ncbi:hypothetical protein [Kangiella sp. TOML190]|uniref:hypothetical protein n=1 Tax=Kangiella sp. TOML190 TaxID=2931351 RepID=UPI00203EC33A|nr:hypothetical protein [Kangiella sp. TOML190]
MQGESLVAPISKAIKATLWLAISSFLFTACSKSNTGEPANGNAANGDKANQGDKGAFSTFDAVGAVEIIESPLTGVALGWGWNRGDSEPIPSICVEFVPGEEPAQTRYMTMKEVNDSYQLMESLGMSAEASVKTIGFEASGKAAFAKSQNINSKSSTFVLNATVLNGVRYASPVPEEGSKTSSYQSDINERGGSRGAIRLTPHALKLAREKNKANFRRHCGSSFVSAIYGGAKLTATISFQSTSKSQKEKLSAQMSGSGWGARFESKVQKGKTESSSSDRMDISIFLTGGKGDAIPSSQQDLIDKLKTLSLDAYVAPKDFQIAITPYEMLSNWPGNPLPDKETEFDQLASYWGAYNTLYDEIEQVLVNPSGYVHWTVDSDGNLTSTVVGCQNEWAAYKQAQKAYQDQYNNFSINGFNTKKINEWKAALETKAKDLDSQSANLKSCEGQQGQLNKQLAEETNESIQRLKRAQDEVLVALRQLENEARTCSDKSDACDFKVENYRSPYAFMIQLPTPIGSEMDSRQGVLDYNVGRIAKSHCSDSPNDLGCLTNLQIEQWGQKLGLESISQKVRADRFAKLVVDATKNQMELIKAGQAVIELGPEKKVIWYNTAPVLAQPESPAQDSAAAKSSP